MTVKQNRAARCNITRKQRLDGSENIGIRLCIVLSDISARLESVYVTSALTWLMGSSRYRMPFLMELLISFSE